MTNSDFRKLLMTPREPGRQSLGTTPRFDHNAKPKLKMFKFIFYYLLVICLIKSYYINILTRAQKNTESAILRKQRKR